MKKLTIKIINNNILKSEIHLTVSSIVAIYDYTESYDYNVNVISFKISCLGGHLYNIKYRHKEKFGEDFRRFYNKIIDLVYGHTNKSSSSNIEVIFNHDTAKIKNTKSDEVENYLKNKITPILIEDSNITNNNNNNNNNNEITNNN